MGLIDIHILFLFIAALVLMVCGYIGLEFRLTMRALRSVQIRPSSRAWGRAISPDAETALNDDFRVRLDRQQAAKSFPWPGGATCLVATFDA